MDTESNIGQQHYLFTEDQFRLQCIKASRGHPYNWLFLPGGPELSSEIYQGFTEKLALEGTIWHVDYPQSSLRAFESFSELQAWSTGLVRLTQTLPNVILVAHALAGMLTLSNSALESYVRGLVLLNTAPSHLWHNALNTWCQQFNLPDINSWMPSNIPMMILGDEWDNITKLTKLFRKFQKQLQGNN